MKLEKSIDQWHRHVLQGTRNLLRAEPSTLRNVDDSRPKAVKEAKGEMKSDNDIDCNDLVQ